MWNLKNNTYYYAVYFLFSTSNHLKLKDIVHSGAFEALCWEYQIIGKVYTSHVHASLYIVVWIEKYWNNSKSCEANYKAVKTI